MRIVIIEMNITGTLPSDKLCVYILIERSSMGMRGKNNSHSLQRREIPCRWNLGLAKMPL
jgi:hypothetical protein